MKGKFFLLLFVVIYLFVYICLNNMIKESNSYEVMSYNNDYEIGSIRIDHINLNRKLMQGLDNKYYFNHNYLNMDSDSGEFFLDTYGDLINNNNAIIYSSVNNIDIYDIRINDLVNINYLDNDLIYMIVSVNKNVKHDLIIKLVGEDKEYNIFLIKQ